MMEFPACPACQKGRLLPLSYGDTTFGYWACSAPECTFIISGRTTPVTYYKGSAIQQEKEKGEKRWTEFEF